MERDAADMGPQTRGQAEVFVLASKVEADFPESNLTCICMLLLTGVGVGFVSVKQPLLPVLILKPEGWPAHMCSFSSAGIAEK